MKMVVVPDAEARSGLEMATVRNGVISSWAGFRDNVLLSLKRDNLAEFAIMQTLFPNFITKKCTLLGSIAYYPEPLTRYYCP
ncbi:hypothetical protein TNCV_1545241 [Trichonephila clavipes]|nr:hypothetical protein TNCV_1545241 [Trichonephila clavipes]